MTHMVPNGWVVSRYAWLGLAPWVTAIQFLDHGNLQPIQIFFAIFKSVESRCMTYENYIIFILIWIWIYVIPWILFSISIVRFWFQWLNWLRRTLILLVLKPTNLKWGLQCFYGIRDFGNKHHAPQNPRKALERQSSNPHLLF